MPKRIMTIFGSPSLAQGSDTYVVCYQLGKALARAGIVTMTGGYEGVMEATSRGAAEAGGEVHGITVETLEKVGASQANQWVGNEIRYPNLRERAAHLIRKTHGYVMMPGGIGTLHEFIQVWQSMRLETLDHKPIFVYEPYWKPMIDHMRGEGFIHAFDLEMLIFFKSPDEVISGFKAWYGER